MRNTVVMCFELTWFCSHHLIAFNMYVTTMQ